MFGFKLGLASICPLSFFLSLFYFVLFWGFVLPLVLFEAGSSPRFCLVMNCKFLSNSFYPRPRGNQSEAAIVLWSQLRCQNTRSLFWNSDNALIRFTVDFLFGNLVNVNSSTPHPLLLTDSKGSTLMCKKYKEFQVGIFWGEGVGWFWGKTRTTVLCGLAPPSIKASITPSHNLNWHSTIPELPITSAANIESDHVFLLNNDKDNKDEKRRSKKHLCASTLYSHTFIFSP